ncbi:MAG: gluconokinase [Betaproteobacteria bacterium]|jgi:carbohydrate kinase (thermoresistant glucokinase family)
MIEPTYTAPPAASMPPAALVIMGVSGSGKTTVAALLAALLRWELADADAFHPATNIQKMNSGIPLTDEDRWPWLQAIAAWIDDTRRAGSHGIVACSALKRSYRDILVGTRHDVRLVYLKGDAALIGQRAAGRRGHFMPIALLPSQFDTLEEPRADENPIVVFIDADPKAVAARILAALQIEAPAR